MAGQVIAVKVEAGDRVSVGDALVLIEALKVESLVQAPADGVVRDVSVAVGDVVEVGAVLLRVEST